MNTHSTENKRTIQFMLVRHGISQSNEAHRVVGWTDVDLSESGIKELNAYKNTVNYIPVERFYSSDLLRARRTFDILFGDQYPLYRTEKGLRESYFGDFEYCSQEENRKHNYFATWLSNTRQGSEELIEDFFERVKQAFKVIALECLHDGINSAGLVLHEGTLKAILLTLQNLPFTHFRSLRFGNGLGIILDVEVSENQLTLLHKTYLRKPDTFNLSLVRHGISKANEDHRFVGWTDVPLGESGAEELRLYRKTVQYPDVQRYYCSDLLRAKQTWEILFKDENKECIFTEGFRENYYGEYEDLPISPKIREYFTNWTNQIKMGSEEDYPTFQKRIMDSLYSAIKESQKDGLNSCGVVAHAGVLKIIYLSIRNHAPQDWHQFQVRNGLGFNFFLEWEEEKLSLVTVDLI